MVHGYLLVTNIQIEHMQVLGEIALECALMYETKQYVLPSEKHMLLKVCILVKNAV